MNLTVGAKSTSSVLCNNATSPSSSSIERLEAFLLFLGLSRRRRRILTAAWFYACVRARDRAARTARGAWVHRSVLSGVTTTTSSIGTNNSNSRSGEKNSEGWSAPRVRKEGRGGWGRAQIKYVYGHTQFGAVWSIAVVWRIVIVTILGG